jgi:hypothetical protein
MPLLDKVQLLPGLASFAAQDVEIVGHICAGLAWLLGRQAIADLTKIVSPPHQQLQALAKLHVSWWVQMHP